MIEKLKEPVEGDLMPGGLEGVITVNRHKINELVDEVNNIMVNQVEIVKMLAKAKIVYLEEPSSDPPRSAGSRSSGPSGRGCELPGHVCAA